MRRISSGRLQAEALLARLSAICIFLASVALVVLIATFGWLVFGRYVLNVTPTWVEQLALLLIGYITFLGAAAGIHEKTHLGVSLFHDMMPPRVQAVIMIIIDIVLAIFGAVMFPAGIELMRFGWDTMLPMLDIPESFRSLSATSCGGLMLLFAGARSVLRILNFIDPATQHTEMSV